MGSRSSIIVLASALGLAALSACYTGSATDGNWVPNGGVTPATTTDPTDPTGLPCDVAQLLADNCTSCHGTALQGTAKSQLLTIDDVSAVADEALARMKDTVSPMPPTGALDADSIAIFESWIAQGMPAGSCDAAPTDEAPPTIALTCTSGTHWTRGTHESPLMKPGGACINCHSGGGAFKTMDDDGDKEDDDDDEGPRFSFAGTVYPSAHDEDDCNGSAETTTSVVLTGADGQSLTLSINAAGNFYTKTALTFPVKAKVVSAAGSRTMKATLDATDGGDCNKCHTAASPSPGRIVEKL